MFDIISSIYSLRIQLIAGVFDDLLHFLRSSDDDAPWSGARVFESRIRRNIKLAEAPSFGQSIFDYAALSAGAHDYGALVEEVLAAENTGEQRFADAA